MRESYVTPQTSDGGVVASERNDKDGVEVTLRFALSDAFLRMVDGRLDALVFAARSRLTRLGIDVIPRDRIALEGDTATLRATVSPTIAQEQLGELLPKVVLPGLPVGRLVFCPPERKLSSEALYAGVADHVLQLPASYSIDARGLFTIRPHRRVYELSREIDLETLQTILAQADGVNLLNRIQLSRTVDDVILRPGEGVVTSCTMFLHRHYVVLARNDPSLGTHLHSIVLDPISTRGSQVFLAFANPSDTSIVNPSVSASVYEATPSPAPAVSAAVPGRARAGSRELFDYEFMRGVFDDLEGGGGKRRYTDRMVAIAAPAVDPAELGEIREVWERDPRQDLSIRDIAAQRSFRDGNGTRARFGTHLLEALPSGARATVLLGLFPNLVEHVQICAAALEAKLGRIVFRRASWEHGPFLSAQDHARLAEYDAFGVEVLWCNDSREHVAMHVFRGVRGFFVTPPHVEKFKNALIFAMYGSAAPLDPGEERRVAELLGQLQQFFGSETSILTGGGPGAMQQITEAAQERGVLVGANYIETLDQARNMTSHFYQSFQDRSRHSRQRWFEIASFQIFFAGGVGTLEEIGLTLTDMKLGLIERAPLVFFGRAGDHCYWEPLHEQLERIVDEGRGPEWLRSHTLITDDPEEVCAFYKRILEVG